MSNRSNNFGRGYEFAWIKVLYDALSSYCNVKIIQNSSYETNKNAWDSLSVEEQKKLLVSTRTAIHWIIELEPLIDESENSDITLSFQADENGVVGDVRDILIERKDISWVIGLSIKHNHDAIKHCRLSSKIDFGANWFDVPCSKDYWQEIIPVFDLLSKLRDQKAKWSKLATKETDIYVPILKAFIKEVKVAFEKDKNVPRKMAEYLLGIFDYHKIVSVESKQITLIQSFNMHGTLNKPSQRRISAITLPFVELPTRLVALEFKPNSKTTVEIYLDNGWQLSFRIHNASTYVEPSLKFDIKFIGIPSTINSIACEWKEVM